MSRATDTQKALNLKSSKNSRLTKTSSTTSHPRRTSSIARKGLEWSKGNRKRNSGQRKRCIPGARAGPITLGMRVPNRWVPHFLRRLTQNSPAFLLSLCFFPLHANVFKTNIFQRNARSGRKERRKRRERRVFIDERQGRHEELQNGVRFSTYTVRFKGASGQ